MRKKICFLIALYRTSNSYILLECTNLAFMPGPFIKFMVESTMESEKWEYHFIVLLKYLRISLVALAR